jgi:hypothetical protein
MGVCLWAFNDKYISFQLYHRSFSAQDHVSMSSVWQMSRSKRSLFLISAYGSPKVLLSLDMLVLYHQIGIM